MKAVLGDAVVAEAPASELVSIEGNWYFPPQSLRTEFFEKSETPYHCPWKGDAQYFNVGAGDAKVPDGAWCYPDPIPSSFERVGSDYSGFVAFDPAITVVDS